MALIDCPKCGKKVSDQADKCIHCNFHIYKSSNESIGIFSPSVRAGFYLKCIVKDAKWYVLTLFAIGFVWGFYNGFHKTLFMKTNSENTYFENYYENSEKYLSSIVNLLLTTQIFASIATLLFFYSIFSKIEHAGNILYKQEFGNSRLEYNGHLNYIGLFMIFLASFIYVLRF